MKRLLVNLILFIDLVAFAISLTLFWVKAPAGFDEAVLYLVVSLLLLIVALPFWNWVVEQQAKRDGG